MTKFFLHVFISNIFWFILISPSFQEDFDYWLPDVFITEKDDDWSKEVVESTKAVLDENEVHNVVDIFKVDLTEDHVDGIGDHKHHNKKHQA